MTNEAPYRELPSICAGCATAIRPEQGRNGLCRPCDAIRSIRIGITLNERFGAVVRGDRYAGRYGAALAIGELEQMYPEIWSHFDNAREALVADGIAVDDYDALRPDAKASAITDVLPTGSVTVFYLDVAGHALATEAGEALKATLPDVDWQALDRADAAQIAAAGAITIPKWKQWVVGTAIVAGTILLLKVFG